MKLLVQMFVALMMMASQMAHAQYAARVTLDGNWYLQQGSVENLTPGVDIVGLRYSTGALYDGGAVFQDYQGGYFAEGFLYPGSDRYSMSSWEMTVNPGKTEVFGGLDLDVLVDTVTFQVNEQDLDFTGSSLKNAYVELTFDDGFYKVLHLNQTGWDKTQVLEFGVSAVPEPSALALMLAGVGVLTVKRKKR